MNSIISGSFIHKVLVSNSISLPIMERDTVQVNFQITIPRTKWLSILNLKYPNLSIKILSKFLIRKDVGNILLELNGMDVTDFLMDLKLLKRTISFHILHQGDLNAIISVEMNDPWILNALVESKLLLIYPLTINNGSIVIDAIAERQIVDDFLENLEKLKIHYTIRRIGQYREKQILSQNQLNTVHVLFNNGYYEVPRKNSLSQLAERLKISPSALSERIRRIHNKLISNYLDGHSY